VPGGSLDGQATPWRDFPAFVPAHGTIRLLITIHRPSGCRGRMVPRAGGFYSGYHRVHWESLFASHTTTIDDGMGDYGIQVC
jgi:hypothetical protein